MLPEGIVERWFIADGAIVAAGDPMAEIRIEAALHEIMAPVSKLMRKLLKKYGFVPDKLVTDELIPCTKIGKFQCEHDAIREGCRPTRNGQ